jgi:arabinose-5-phosphate isomerase
MELIGYGQKVLRQEADSIRLLADNLNESFSHAVQMLFDCSGRVVTCGVGKSGHVARKAAGTLSSTGTPSIFLHAAEAVHGDLGSVTALDVVLLYTHSGETDEIVRLMPSFKVQGARTILITGRPHSSAGRAADLCLNTHVAEEACPNNLAPTTSTTVMMALSDALALAVMEMREFTSEDYAKLHPGGTLGRRLLLTVRDLMRTGADVATVSSDAPLIDVMTAINKAGAGGACVITGENELAGFISDGDLRRHLSTSADPFTARAADVMSKNVTTIEPFLMAVEALEFFQTFYQTQTRKISEIPVIEDKKVIGLLMLKDLLKSGIAF